MFVLPDEAPLPAPGERRGGGGGGAALEQRGRAPAEGARALGSPPPQPPPVPAARPRPLHHPGPRRLRQVRGGPHRPPRWAPTTTPPAAPLRVPVTLLQPPTTQTLTLANNRAPAPHPSASKAPSIPDSWRPLHQLYHEMIVRLDILTNPAGSFFELIDKTIQKEDEGKMKRSDWLRRIVVTH